MMQPKPASKKDYSNPEFWNRRYQQNQLSFDWYVEYPELSYCFNTLYGFPLSSRILMVGCGNSLLSEQMYDAGFTDITNIDISHTVITQMIAEMEPKQKPMKWLMMDALNMTFANNSFDVVIDKGTLDALICGEDLSLSQQLMREMGRVAGEGKVMIVTHSGPEGRRRVFKEGLDFARYDYFFSKIYLSNSNILVNLMKANKGNGELENDKQVLARSWFQFSLVQLKKRKTKPEKMHIVWSNFAPKNPQEERHEVEVSPLVAEEKGQFQKEEPQQASTELKQQGTESPVEVKKDEGPSLNPKQPYCFVYVVSRKPYSDLQETLKIENLLTVMREKGQDQAKQEKDARVVINPDIKECVCVRTSQMQPCLLAIRYLQLKGYQLPRVAIESLSNNTDKHTINQEGENPLVAIQYRVSSSPNVCSVLISMRSQMDFNLTLPSSNPLGITAKQFQSIDKVSAAITELAEDDHPTPHQYEQIARLAEGGGETINQLINSLWRPETIVTGFKISTDTIVVSGKVYLQPNASQKKYAALQNSVEGLQVGRFSQGYFDRCPRAVLSSVSSMCRSYGEMQLELGDQQPGEMDSSISTQIERLWLPYIDQTYLNIDNGVEGVFNLTQRVAVYALIAILSQYCRGGSQRGS